MTEDMGDLTGSRASTEPASRLGPSGFDPDRDVALGEIGSIISWWLRYDAESRKREGLEIHPDNHIIPPCWPTRGQLMNWMRVMEPRETRWQRMKRKFWAEVRHYGQIGAQALRL